ncbi:PTS glucitol/sorbitol transporter subunit IIC [Enterococcus mundtii]|uniref:PTS sorbitol transporter subunit IIC n=1 Tax=Enterococcus mundtii TaxID=53346 RepID=A0A2S7RTA4_ENTMU|nr:PTS glucitol/sorbitol transporter subunit IIC [Enterococcus mundtii]MDA9460264.1 PTS system, glucitol, sorbitol-specific IIC component [Enterococcus mundtii 3F]PQF22928.1 PTS sorbitol transporter subunit IIC [Enterococcus mundtii]
MDFLVSIAENFIGVFDAGGENLMGLITGILPTLVVLLTFVNALIALVGEERVSSFAQFCTKNILLRYSIFPLLAVFFLTNPMCYSFGRFLKEKQKPAFYDSAVSLVHPITGLFPHANAGELFVWTGIASGLTTLGLSVMPLAVRYFLVGMVVITIRGIVTELLTKIMWKETAE